jgi:choline dehydrogenase-like flavoprotein
MGSDPQTSVINPDHRTHDVKNLFLCDGSSLVTSGRGQPTMTIQPWHIEPLFSQSLE